MYPRKTQTLTKKSGMEKIIFGKSCTVPVHSIQLQVLDILLSQLMYTLLIYIKCTCEKYVYILGRLNILYTILYSLILFNIS